MNRFQQIYSWVEKNKPGIVLETGTWNGLSAKHMLKLGAKKYIGFDVWEDGSDELDKIENNVKKRVDKSEVEETLKDFDVELIQGNTRFTLKEYAKNKKPFVDMAIIDGGHSYSTIKSDFINLIQIVKTEGVIFIDDYYFGCANHKIGANMMLAELNLPFTVLPKVDKAKDGYLIKMVQVEMKYVPRVDWEAPKKAWKFTP